jgi:hypothetical protein
MVHLRALVRRHVLIERQRQRAHGTPAVLLGQQPGESVSSQSVRVRKMFLLAVLAAAIGSARGAAPVAELLMEGERRAAAGTRPDGQGWSLSLEKSDIQLKTAQGSDKKKVSGWRGSRGLCLLKTL